ncbi:MAG: DUF3108 domain-containing protein [Gammaproteobacteria bacterium]
MLLFRYCLFSSLLAMAAGGVVAGEDALPPPDFKVGYSLYMSGIKVAKVERRFSRSSDGTYRYLSEASVTGLIALFRDDRIVEESHGRINGSTIMPDYYKYSRTGSKKARDVSVHFNWDSNRVTNRVNGDAWHMDVEPGILDKLLYQYIIMRDLKKDKSTLTYTVADGGKAKTYHFESLGREVINTPLGEMETIKLGRYKSGSKRELIIWCAPDLHYLPVKVRDMEEDNNYVAVINSLDGLTSQESGVRSQE